MDLVDMISSITAHEPAIVLSALVLWRILRGRVTIVIDFTGDNNGKA